MEENEEYSGFETADARERETPRAFLWRFIWTLLVLTGITAFIWYYHTHGSVRVTRFEHRVTTVGGNENPSVFMCAGQRLRIHAELKEGSAGRVRIVILQSPVAAMPRHLHTSTLETPGKKDIELVAKETGMYKIGFEPLRGMSEMPYSFSAEWNVR